MFPLVKSCKWPSMFLLFYICMYLKHIAKQFIGNILYFWIQRSRILIPDYREFSRLLLSGSTSNLKPEIDLCNLKQINSKGKLEHLSLIQTEEIDILVNLNMNVYMTNNTHSSLIVTRVLPVAAIQAPAANSAKVIVLRHHFSSSFTI